MKLEMLPNNLENRNVGFENANSFEELFEMIRNQGEIVGTQKVYTPEELIKKIEQVRHGHREIGFITRSYGLNSIVEKLLQADKIYNKYVLKKGKKD